MHYNVISVDVRYFGDGLSGPKWAFQNADEVVGNAYMRSVH
jgi:hypothetical protein